MRCADINGRLTNIAHPKAATRLLPKTRIIISSMIICGLCLMILSFVNHQFYPKQPVTCCGQLSVFALLSFYIWFCSIPGSTTVRARSIKWLSRPWPDNTHCAPENRKQPAYTGNRVPATKDYHPEPWVHTKMPKCDFWAEAPHLWSCLYKSLK